MRSPRCKARTMAAIITSTMASPSRSGTSSSLVTARLSSARVNIADRLIALFYVCRQHLGYLSKEVFPQEWLPKIWKELSGFDLQSRVRIAGHNHDFGL